MELNLRITFFILTCLGLIFTLYFINNTNDLYELKKLTTSFSASQLRDDSNLFHRSETCDPVVAQIEMQEVFKTDYIFMMPRPKEIIYRNVSSHISNVRDAWRVLVFSNHIRVETTCNDCQNALADDFNSTWFNVFKRYDQSVAIPIDIFCKNNRAANLTILDYKYSNVAKLSITSIYIVLQKQFAGDLTCIVGKYELLIDMDYVKIVSCSEEGIRYSFSSLSQIVENFQIIELPIIVRDWPKYSWRGMLIDVARHFIPMRQLYRSVEAMAATKINVLHLHLTDSQVYFVSNYIFI